jgi:phage tail-like protein
VAEFSVNAQRIDPYLNSKFVVKFDGKTPVPGIFRVSSLKRITAPVAHRTGTEQSEEHLAPGMTTWAPIVLERGRTHDTSFEDWANLVWTQGGVMSPAKFRRDVRIELQDEQGTTVMAFTVQRAWPSEYVPLGPLDADAPATAVETLTLQHEGVVRDLAVKEPKET